MKNKIGTLYGIGVGPGDPDLITLKAVKVLGQVDIVFAAASTKNHHSLAMDIARPHVPESTPVELLRFPMTRDKSETRRAWTANARRIVGELEAGRDAAFLTLGDSLTYSTFGYLMAFVKARAPHFRVLPVPGITSYQAAAARVAQPLVEAEESLLVIPGVCSAEKLEKLLACADNAVILKAYRNLQEIRETLSRLDLAGSSVFVSRVGLPGELVHENLDDAPDDPHYFSLILVRKRTT